MSGVPEGQAAIARLIEQAWYATVMREGSTGRGEKIVDVAAKAIWSAGFRRAGDLSLDDCKAVADRMRSRAPRWADLEPLDVAAIDLELRKATSGSDAGGTHGRFQAVSGSVGHTEPREGNSGEGER